MDAIMQLVIDMTERGEISEHQQQETYERLVRERSRARTRTLAPRTQPNAAPVARPHADRPVARTVDRTGVGGRRPIGDVAMTNAERMRRYRANKKGRRT